MPETRGPIHAVIGVRHDGPKTWYVKRSMKMENYPGVWSLPSIRCDPADLRNPSDLSVAQANFDRLSAQRLGGAPLKVRRFLLIDTSDMNPMGVDVTLAMYEIEAPEDLDLVREFYVDSAWMMPADYELASAGQPCGMCLRMWSDWAWLNGITDRPFVPKV